MFFEDIAQVPQIAKKTGFSIFALPGSVEVNFGTNCFILAPNEKGKITIDMVRDVIDLCKSKQTRDFFIVVKQAEAMNEQAQNAFLKLLEEPLEHYHIVLLTKQPFSLLPTVLSRASLYLLKTEDVLSQPVEADETVKKYAKLLITANARNLSKIVKDLTAEKEYKKRENARPFTMGVVGAAIEILYKSYFMTGNVAYARKLPKFLLLYDNLKQNGNIKLHLVADLC